MLAHMIEENLMRRAGRVPDASADWSGATGLSSGPGSGLASSRVKRTLNMSGVGPAGSGSASASAETGGGHVRDESVEEEPKRRVSIGATEVVDGQDGDGDDDRVEMEQEEQEDDETPVLVGSRQSQEAHRFYPAARSGGDENSANVGGSGSALKTSPADASAAAGGESSGKRLLGDLPGLGAPGGSAALSKAAANFDFALE